MKKFFGFLLIYIFILPGVVVAQDETNNVGDAVTMKEVVVSAGRVEEEKKEVTSNVLIIDDKEIRASSAHDLGDLLAENGIGHIQKYPAGLTSIGIRGFRTETHGNDLKGHVLILLNGRRAGTGNVAKLMAKNIERVEIIRGPASVQYGSAAMGGIVNVITKQGKDEPGVFVEGILGSFHHEEGSMGLSGKVSGFDFSGSYTRESMHGDYDTGDGEKFANTGFDRKENISLNLGYEFLPGNRIGVIFNRYVMDEAGSPGYLSKNDLDDYTNNKNESFDIILDGGTSNGLFSWMARYFDGKDEDKWFDPAASDPDIFYDDGIPSEMKIDQQGAQAQVSFDNELLLLTAGMDWVNYEIETSWTPEKIEYDNPAFFLLAKARLLEHKFIISGGLRYDDYEVEVIQPAGRTESDSKLTPSLGFAYLLTDNIKFRVNYGEAFVMPGADQMAADYMVGVTHYVGNPNLDPEKSRTYEGGIDFTYGPFNSSLTFFHTKFKDYIEDTFTAVGDKTWDNIGKATMQGLEGAFKCDIGVLFEWSLEVKPFVNFVYMTEYEDEETRDDLKYISDLNLSYGIVVSDGKGFSSKLNFAYTGKQTVDDYEGGAWPTPEIRKGGFTVANFTIEKEILNFNEYGALTLKGEIINLFDKNYSYVKGYPMQGRSFFFGMRYDY